MSDTVRVGVIGAGVMGRYHCETLALRLPGAELVAVGCPQCTAMLEGVVGPRPEVKDIAELVAEALLESPAAASPRKDLEVPA